MHIHGSSGRGALRPLVSLSLGLPRARRYDYRRGQLFWKLRWDFASAGVTCEDERVEEGAVLREVRLSTAVRRIRVRAPCCQDRPIDGPHFLSSCWSGTCRCRRARLPCTTSLGTTSPWA